MINLESSFWWVAVKEYYEHWIDSKVIPSSSGKFIRLLLLLFTFQHRVSFLFLSFVDGLLLSSMNPIFRLCLPLRSFGRFYRNFESGKRNSLSSFQRRHESFISINDRFQSVCSQYGLSMGGDSN